MVHGLTLYGLKPDALFAPVDKQLLIDAFLDMLQWYQTVILDVFHDPKGQYSVLSACRVLTFMKEDKLLSKSEGGKLLLSQEPNNEVVTKALAIRNGEDDVDITKEEASCFLAKVVNNIETIHQ